MKKTIYLLLIIIFYTVAIAKPLYAGNLDYKSIYKLRGPAVVVIRAVRQDGSGSSGTGSIIKKNGLVITNAHVIIDDSTNRVYPYIFVFLKPDKIVGDRKEDLRHRYKAKAIKYSNKLDLALLKIISLPQDLSIIPFVNPDFVEIGDPVLAIGHPEQGGLWTLTTGVISTRIKDFENIKGKDVFQTETSFNRGNSGGPLINLAGDMVGINSNIARKGEGGIAITDINFSISSGVAKKWINEIGFNIAYAIQPEKRKPTDINKVDLKFEQYPVIPSKPEKTPEPEKKLEPMQKAEPKKVPEPKQLMEERKKLWAQGTQLTPKRPYMPESIVIIEDEMKSMMERMRKKFR